MEKIFTTFAPIFLIVFTALHANPKGASVANGDVHLHETGSLLEIHASDKAILNWENFSILAGETTRFIQPSADAAVLNRVTGLEISQIDGLLEASGHIYLVNPNGVIIGSQGRIDTAGFIASTLDMQNGEFLSGENIALKGLELSEIVNLGQVETKAGPIVLIAHRIENQGELVAKEGSISLLSGHDILFDPRGDHLLFISSGLKGDGIENSGKIEALKIELTSDAAPTSRAVGLGGIVEASSIEKIGGAIYLTAKEGDIAVFPEAEIKTAAGGKVFTHAEKGTVEFEGKIVAPSGEVRLLGEDVYLIKSASIDASGEEGGGTVLAGGDYKGSNPEIPNAKRVYTSPDAIIDVSGVNQGNGGKAIFWGDEGIVFSSTVKACGGSEGGDGGFVEVSSPGAYFCEGFVSTLAPKGKVGTLLLDPTDITISDITAGGSFSMGTFSGPGPTATINVAQLAVFLEGGDVIIDATAGAGGSGNITFDRNLSFSEHTLTLLNSGSITLNANLILSGTANINGNMASSSISASSGNVLLIGSITLDSSAITDFFMGITGGSGNNLSFGAASFVCTKNTNITFGLGTGSNQFFDSYILNTGTGEIAFTGSGGDIDITRTSLFSGGDISIALGPGPGTLFINFTESNMTSTNGSLSFSCSDGLGLGFGFGAILSAPNGDISFSTIGAPESIILLESLSASANSLAFSPGGNFFGTAITLGGVDLTSSSSSITITPSVGSLGLGSTVNLTASSGSVNLASITSSSGIELNITAGENINLQGNIPMLAGGVLTLAAGGDVSLSGTFTAQSGPLEVTAGGSFSLPSGSNLASGTSLSLSANSNIEVGGSIQASLGSLEMTAGNDFLLSDGSMIQGSGIVNLLAGRNFIGTGSGTIQTNGAVDLNIVADNLFPNPFDFGRGYISLPNYTLQTNGSDVVKTNKVYLYTSIPGINTFPPVINGEVNTGTNNQFIGYWYVTLPPPDPPFFEIIFKAVVLNPAVVEAVEVSVTEPLTNQNADDDVVEGTLQPASTPNPKAKCRTPPVAVQASG